MKQTLYICSDGEIKRKGNTIYFETEKEKKFIPVENVSELLIFGEVTLNKRFLEFLTQSEIIVHFFNYYDYYIGSYYPREHFNSGHMILKQAEHYLDGAKRIDLARRFVTGAVDNILKVLAYYENRGKNLGDVIKKIEGLKRAISLCEDVEALMAIEGNIREVYYGGFDQIVGNKDFAFEARTKRPPKNPMNALISFGNSIVYAVCLSEIYKTHLDPRIGFLHATNFRRFTLNLDVAEVFKPTLVDRVIFSLVNKGEIKASHFEKKLEGVVLNDAGRRIFVKEMDERLKSTFQHKKLGRHVSYRELIKLELFKIEKHLMGDKEYEPFVAWW